MDTKMSDFVERISMLGELQMAAEVVKHLFSYLDGLREPIPKRKTFSRVRKISKRLSTTLKSCKSCPLFCNFMDRFFEFQSRNIQFFKKGFLIYELLSGFSDKQNDFAVSSLVLFIIYLVGDKKFTSSKIIFFRKDLCNECEQIAGNQRRI